MLRKAFAQCLDVSPNTIVNLEINRISKTRAERTYCSLNLHRVLVNEKWLRQDTRNEKNRYKFSYCI